MNSINLRIGISFSRSLPPYVYQSVNSGAASLNSGTLIQLQLSGLRLLCSKALQMLYSNLLFRITLRRMLQRRLPKGSLKCLVVRIPNYTSSSSTIYYCLELTRGLVGCFSSASILLRSTATRCRSARLYQLQQSAIPSTILYAR